MRDISMTINPSLTPPSPTLNTKHGDGGWQLSFIKTEPLDYIKVRAFRRSNGTLNHNACGARIGLDVGAQQVLSQSPCLDR